MRRLSVCLFFLLFSALATANYNVYYHPTCQINIRTFLKNSSGERVRYDFDTIKKIITPLKEKGYRDPEIVGGNHITLNINSYFDDVRIMSNTDVSKPTYNSEFCWNVSVNVVDEGKNDFLIIGRDYKNCWGKDNINEVRKLAAEKDTFDATLYLKAFEGSDLPGAIEKVLFGATQQEMIDHENKIPTDIGILNDMPYCCTSVNECLKTLQANN